MPQRRHHTLMRTRGGSRHTGGTRTGRRPRRQNGRKNATNGRRASGNSGTSSNGWVRHGTALPGWTDLEPSNRRRRAEGGGSFLERVSTTRFALVILALGAAFTLYVGHVHSTTDLLNDLQAARAENQQLHLKHNRLQGEFDRRTGPSVIYERARDMGLRASVSYGPPITIDH